MFFFSFGIDWRFDIVDVVLVDLNFCIVFDGEFKYWGVLDEIDVVNDVRVIFFVSVFIWRLCGDNGSEGFVDSNIGFGGFVVEEGCVGGEVGV